MEIKLESWQSINIISILVFAYALPFKLMQVSSFPNNQDVYFYDLYSEFFYSLSRAIFSRHTLDLWGFLLSYLTILFTISILFIIYSINYKKPYLCMINNVIFSSILLFVLYVLFAGTSSSILYVGWGTYLLIASALFSISSIIFVLKDYKEINKDNIKQKLLSNEFKAFYIVIWLIFIINIIILIIQSM